VGVASNGGGAFWLVLSGANGEWAGLHPMVALHLWGSAIVAAAIAIGLLYCELRPPVTRTS